MSATAEPVVRPNGNFLTNLFTSQSEWTREKITDLSDISPAVQQHLVKVYTCLAAALACSAVGSFISIYFNLASSRFVTALPLFGLLGLFFFYRSATTVTSKFAFLTAIGFFQGMALGPLLKLSLAVAPELIFTAFLLTAVIFVCFTVAALVCKKRQYLYMGGILSSCLSGLALVGIMQWMTGSSVLQFVQLVFGLMVFCAYVLFDTQMIIHSAEQGNTDFVAHSISLFLDFIAIFVRVLVILLETFGEKKRKDDD